MKATIATHVVVIILALAFFQPSAMGMMVTDGVEGFELGSGYLNDWTMTNAFGRVLTEPGSMLAELGGNQYALIVGDRKHTGSLSQQVMLDSSHATLEFDYAVGSLMPSSDSFEVTLSNGTESIVLLSEDIDLVDRSAVGNPDLVHMTVDLTDYDLSEFWGKSATLSFAVIDEDVRVNSGFALDNVHMTCAPPETKPVTAPPVPEPATILLLGGGLIGAAVHRLRRRRA